MQTKEYEARAGVWSYRVVRDKKISYYRELAPAMADSKRDNSAKLQHYQLPIWVDVKAGDE